jgi:hypothetical protein
VHAGLAAPASQQLNEQLKAEFTSMIEQLLSEKASDLSAANAAVPVAAAN